MSVKNGGSSNWDLHAPDVVLALFINAKSTLKVNKSKYLLGWYLLKTFEEDGGQNRILEY